MDLNLKKLDSNLIVKFVSHNNGNDELVITNIGGREAKDIKIIFDGRSKFAFIDKVKKNLPIHLKSNESVTILVKHDDTKPNHSEAFVLVWFDNMNEYKKRGFAR